jgi:triosephosphate isomerase
MRRPLVAGNAKMNLAPADLAALLARVREDIEREPARAEVAYCPPFTLLAEAERVLRGSPVHWGGQDLHWESSGAFTGEISALMLREAGCRFVIVGHSERRQLFGETDASVRRKIRAALTAGLVPIVCVGETERERDAGETDTVLRRQVEAGLGGLSLSGGESLVLAYEPVWAIGTGRTASPEQAQEAHAGIREVLASVLGAETADAVRILYGGSVKPSNAGSLLQAPDIDGALVGGASLEAESFLAIVRAASRAAPEA